MKCPRCNTVAEHCDLGHGQYTITCYICGFYQSQYINEVIENGFVHEIKTLTPLGVVVKLEGQHQYFTKSQLHKLLDTQTIGYSYFEKSWKFRNLSLKKTVEVNSLWASEHQV